MRPVSIPSTPQIWLEHYSSHQHFTHMFHMLKLSRNLSMFFPFFSYLRPAQRSSASLFTLYIYTQLSNLIYSHTSLRHLNSLKMRLFHSCFLKPQAYALYIPVGKTTLAYSSLSSLTFKLALLELHIWSAQPHNLIIRFNSFIFPLISLLHSILTLHFYHSRTRPSLTRQWAYLGGSAINALLSASRSWPRTNSHLYSHLFTVNKVNDVPEIFSAYQSNFD